MTLHQVSQELLSKQASFLEPGEGGLGPVWSPLVWHLSLVFNLSPFSVPNSKTMQCWIN